MRAALPWLCGAWIAGCGRLDFDPHSGPAASGTAWSLLYLNKTTASELLVDVPVLVALDDQHLDRRAMRDDGSDLRFYQVDGGAPPVTPGEGRLLAHEIEDLGGGGAPLLAWVRVPMLSGRNTTLQVTYGGAEVPPPSTEAVWGSSYLAVFHFAEAAGVPVDAAGRFTAPQISLRGAAPGPDAVPGRIGRGRRFQSAQRHAIQLDARGVTYTPFTVSGWCYEAALPVPGASHALASREHFGAGDDVFWLGDSGGAYLGEVTRADGLIDLPASGPRAAAVTQRWVHLALTASEGAASLFVDGEQVATAAVAGQPPAGNEKPINLGADVNDGDDVPDDDLLDGMLDEVRIERVARSPEWLRIDQLSTTDQLITYGDLQRRASP